MECDVNHTGQVSNAEKPSVYREEKLEIFFEVRYDELIDSGYIKRCELSSSLKFPGGSRTIY
ncbi:hypothetical protein D1872_341990 [compost metagenome]